MDKTQRVLQRKPSKMLKGFFKKRGRDAGVVREKADCLSLPPDRERCDMATPLDLQGDYGGHDQSGKKGKENESANGQSKKEKKDGNLFFLNLVQSVSYTTGPSAKEEERKKGCSSKAPCSTMRRTSIHLVLRVRKFRK